MPIYIVGNKLSSKNKQMILQQTSKVELQYLKDTTWHLEGRSSLNIQQICVSLQYNSKLIVHKKVLKVCQSPQITCCINPYLNAQVFITDKENQALANIFL